MPATPFDSAHLRDVFLDREVGSLFTDSAEIRAMLLVEGALARVQGRLGLIPEISAEAIWRASQEILVDPSGLAHETGPSAVCVPALVTAFRKAMEAPEHAQYLHWGATSQDIIDTGLVLRLRQVVALFDTRLGALTAALGRLAETHAELPMAARTWGQAATVTSFGAVVAQWGRPLLRQRQRLETLKADLLCVSLSGAAGTLSAMGAKGPQVRAALAEALKLADPGASWHVERDRIAALGGWIAATAASLGKTGEDLSLLTQSGIAEVRLGQVGGSSTMPQKSNPVLPALLIALGRHSVALNGLLAGAGAQRQERDGAAWMCEWLSLPQMCMGLGRALTAAGELAATLSPDPRAMARGIDPDGLGLIHAEALSFALAARMPRPEAQAAVKALCVSARETGTPLPRLARERWPEAGLAALFDPSTQMGTAPAEARAFAAAARG